MNKGGRCVHFTGIQNSTCNAGVRYDDVRASGPVPCLTLNGKRNDCCNQYLEPTPEQIAADEREFEEAMEQMRVVMTVVQPWRSWTTTNRVAKQGMIECPACKGRLHLSQAAYNGHVRGKCETERCLNGWNECT